MRRKKVLPILLLVLLSYGLIGCESDAIREHEKVRITSNSATQSKEIGYTKENKICKWSHDHLSNRIQSI